MPSENDFLDLNAEEKEIVSLCEQAQTTPQILARLSQRRSYTHVSTTCAVLEAKGFLSRIKAGGKMLFKSTPLAQEVEATQ